MESFRKYATFGKVSHLPNLGVRITMWNYQLVFRLFPMTTPSLNNYLRTYRKRSGLTQGEVAFLLGCKNAGQVSRYERHHRVPTLRTALTCASVLRVPLEKLFAGVQQEVAREASERLATLRLNLETKSSNGHNSKRSTKKLGWLTQVDNPNQNIGKQLP